MYSSGKAAEAPDFVKTDSRIRVLVCTIAFGMGVDIHDLRYCEVEDVPEDPSIFKQEFQEVESMVFAK
jgi:superfamily II DNA helicase RecQ